jgi:hypothetical protein
MKAKSFVVLGVVIVLIIIGVLVLQAGGRLPFLDRWLDNLNPFKPQPTTITIGDAIITDISQVSQLTTTIFTIQQVVEGGYNKASERLNLFGGDFWMIMVVKGTVEAGLDLDQLDTSDVIVSEDGKNITVNLPPVKILTEISHIVSSNSGDTYVYDFWREPFAQSDDIETVLRANAGAQILATACEDGILDDATEDARIAIDEFLKTTLPNVTVAVVSGPVPSVEACKAK